MKHSCPVADVSRKPDGWWWLVLNTPGTNVNSIHEAPRQTAGTRAGLSSGLDFCDVRIRTAANNSSVKG